jgi:hypothetical protein
MRLRKTRRHNKRKTIRRRKTAHRRRGGVNNNNNNAQFQLELVAMIDRRDGLINDLQDIIDRAIESQGQNNVNEMTFVDEIRAFEPEADMIDNFFNNHEIENMLNQRIEDIMNIFGLINLNNNNNETITLPNYNRNNNNNNIFMN